MLSPGCVDFPVAAAAAAFDGIVLAGDQTTSVVTPSLANTALVLPVEANKAYLVRVEATISRDSGASGVAFAFSGPTGASIDGFISTSGNALTNVISARYNVIGVVSGTTFAMNVLGQIFFWGRLLTSSTPGDLTFQFTCGAGSNVRRIHAGSRMRLLEISAEL